MIRRILSLAVCLASLSARASADPLSLQQILDSLVVSGPPIDAGAPQHIELWDNASGPMTANVVLDFTGRSDAVWMGMYPAGNSANRAFLLADTMTPADVASVAFNQDGSIVIRDGLEPLTTAAGFDGPFGFFAKIASATSDSPVYLFTQADLNGGEARAKVFAGNGLTTLRFPGLQPGLFLQNQYLIAWETGDDGGFNDLIVSVAGIVPVPEPVSMGILGIASLVALRARRVRSG